MLLWLCSVRVCVSVSFFCWVKYGVCALTHASFTHIHHFSHLTAFKHTHTCGVYCKAFVTTPYILLAATFAHTIFLVIMLCVWQLLILLLARRMHNWQQTRQKIDTQRKPTLITHILTFALIKSSCFIFEYSTCIYGNLDLSVFAPCHWRYKML